MRNEAQGTRGDRRVKRAHHREVQKRRRREFENAYLKATRGISGVCWVNRCYHSTDKDSRTLCSKHLVEFLDYNLKRTRAGLKEISEREFSREFTACKGVPIPVADIGKFGTKSVDKSRSRSKRSKD